MAPEISGFFNTLPLSKLTNDILVWLIVKNKAWCQKRTCYIHQSYSRKIKSQHLLTYNLGLCSSKSFDSRRWNIEDFFTVIKSLEIDLSFFIITTENPHFVSQRCRTWPPNFRVVFICEVDIIINFSWTNSIISMFKKWLNELCLPLNPIIMGSLSEDQVLNINTASFAFGSVVVVASEVVEVIVGEISSHSYESHGHPPGQFS